MGLLWFYVHNISAQNTHAATDTRNLGSLGQFNIPMTHVAPGKSPGHNRKTSPLRSINVWEMSGRKKESGLKKKVITRKPCTRTSTPAAVQLLYCMAHGLHLGTGPCPTLSHDAIGPPSPPPPSTNALPEHYLLTRCNNLSYFSLNFQVSRKKVKQTCVVRLMDVLDSDSPIQVP